MAMVETAVVLLAVVGALVFVMRMDEDPNRWQGSRSRPADAHRRTDAEDSSTTAPGSARPDSAAQPVD
jgi:hypothetical protein